MKVLLSILYTIRYSFCFDYRYDNISSINVISINIYIIIHI